MTLVEPFSLSALHVALITGYGYGQLAGQLRRHDRG